MKEKMIRETIEEVVLQKGFLNGVMAGAKEIGLDLNTQRFTKLSDEIKEKRNKVMIPTMIKTIIGSIHKVEKTFKGMDKRFFFELFYFSIYPRTVLNLSMDNKFLFGEAITLPDLDCLLCYQSMHDDFVNQYIFGFCIYFASKL